MNMYWTENVGSYIFTPVRIFLILIDGTHLIHSRYAGLVQPTVWFDEKRETPSISQAGF